MQYLDYNEKKPHGTELFPLAYYSVDEAHPQYHMPWHWHMEYEIIRIRTGGFTIFLDNKEIQAAAGDLLFICDGVLHGGIPGEGCRYECLVFDFRLLRKANELCSRRLSPLAQHELFIYEHIRCRNGSAASSCSPEAADCSAASSCFPEAADCSTASSCSPKAAVCPTPSVRKQLWCDADEVFCEAAKSAPDPLTLLGSLLRLFGFLLSQHFYLTAGEQTPRNDKRILSLKQSLEFMERNHASALSLAEISHAAGMTPKYFCRIFRELVHKTPIDYLNHYRIERAVYLLQNTELTVSEIAGEVGFNDLSYFIKTFKRYQGITPQRMRKGSPIDGA